MQFTRDAIGAQEDEVARVQPEFKEINLNFRLDPHGPGQYAAVLVFPGLLRVDQPLSKLLGGNGVIVRDLPDRSLLRHDVGPAVTHAGHEQVTVSYDGGHQGSAHAVPAGVGLGHGVNLGVGLFEGCPQALSRVVRRMAVVCFKQGVDGLPAGDFAGRSPAHAVRHGIQPPFSVLQLGRNPHGIGRSVAVLIQVADRTPVGVV